MLWKCYIQHASKFGKLHGGHKTGKSQFSLQSQRKAMPKNVQTTTQLYSSHTVAKKYSKFSKPGINRTVNFQMFKVNLEKAEEPEIKLPTSVVSSKKQERSRKHLLLLYWLCQTFDSVDHNKMWIILQEIGIADHLTCLLRNLCAGQEATVRTRHGTTHWYQVGKGIRQGCILSPCLFNLHAEYIMQTAGLGEAQAGIKIAWRNINNLRYADDTTLMAESKEEEEPLDEVKEESEKAGLKLNIQKMKMIASSPITSWLIDGETMTDYVFLFQNHCRWWLQPWN